MNYTFKENQLDYETYYILRKSVKWNNGNRQKLLWEIHIIQLLFLITKFPLEWGELSVMVFIL